MWAEDVQPRGVRIGSLGEAFDRRSTLPALRAPMQSGWVDVMAIRLLAALHEGQRLFPASQPPVRMPERRMAQLKIAEDGLRPL